MTGLTGEQRAMFADRFCRLGHRFDGANYPTPEGNCPLCTWPVVREEINHYQRLLADDASSPRAALHPSLTGFS